MQREILNFNSIPYLVEYHSYKDMQIKHSEKFAMLRRYDIVNDIAVDREIYFATFEDFTEAVKYDEQDKEFYQTDRICYPINNGQNFSISSDILRFTESTRLSSCFFNSNKDKDYYRLMKKSKNDEGNIIEEPIEVYCDEIRIYRPHKRRNVASIIDIYNIVNNIHFHYFCQLFDEQEIKVCPEITYNNERYYEYITFYIPSIDYLFAKNIVGYFEDLNIIQYSGENQYNESLSYLSDLILPYGIEKVCAREEDCKTCPIFETCDKIDIKDLYVKSYKILDIYSDEYLNTEYNYKNVPLNIVLYHYDMIEESFGTYISSESIIPASVSFINDNTFELSSRLDFDIHNQSILSIISEFKYPQVLKPDGTNMTLEEAYFYFNKISNKEEYYEFEGHEDETFLSAMSEEFIDALEFNSAGYVLELSNNLNFDGVFYRKAIGADEIDNFTFNLDGFFTDWNEYTDVIFARTLFIDKFLSKMITGNFLIITKEKFKYCINESLNDHRIIDLVKKQKPIDSIYKESLNLDNNTDDMQIFFIDKLKCSINKHDITNEQVVINGNAGNSTVVYKTVFYKTQDLQNIKIRSTVTQKIGINLSNYFSKVETFKLKLAGYEFVETERNDIYVIFTIPGSFITTTVGYYDIVNENDEYIDSGTFTVI